MYLGHFALREAPFSITPDTDFYFAHDGAQATLNTLLVALRSGEGFLKVVGELGCGKTVLCRQLLKTLHSECVTAYIPNPDMGPDDLLCALAAELGLDVQLPTNRHTVMTLIGNCLLNHAAAGRRVVVCIDEAQAIPVRSLESLRLVSNLETEKRKLIQLVLLGQPDLDTKLARPEIRQLLQRITFSEYLGPMAGASVGDYVRHRLARAAATEHTDLEVFTPEAIDCLAVATAGVPRLINILAHKCLILAYGQGVHRVSAMHVKLAVRDTPGLRPFHTSGGPWWNPWNWWRRRSGPTRTAGEVLE